MQVLIIGGGIAGNSLAFWLSKLGHVVTVIERFPSLRSTGLQVDLRGHGIEVLKYMGLEKTFLSKSAPEQGLQIVNSSGKRRAYFPANKSGKGVQSFTSEYEIMRGDLCRLIYDATKDRVKYVFGMTVESFEEKDGYVEVHFKNGKMDRFDLLVGADGQWSHTRRMMLGPDTTDAFYPLNGVYVAYFTIPQPIQDGEGYIATSYMAPGRRGILTRRHSPEAIQVYLGGTTDSERLKNARRGNVKEEKSALTEMFQGAGWQTEEILEAMKDAGDFYCERMGLVKLDSWSRCRVTLVGDAAHCSSANSGMGTTSAVVGAYILAGEIGKLCVRFNEKDNDGGNSANAGEEINRGNEANDLVAALKSYERKFQPFMTQVQRGLDKEDTKWDTILWTPFGIATVHCLLGMASFLKVNIGKYFLREDVKGWELPRYEELLRN
jgi:2-polyprenyl-6-methoxyphenol hydroxylase-like FAD-dependent oxidoreductase